MTRLPDLERALFDAAERQDHAQRRAGRAPRRRHWGRRTLLATATGLTVSAAALAATTGLLGAGDPVPADRSAPYATPLAGSGGFTLASVRAADPSGGPAWGLGLYEARTKPTTPAQRPRSAEIAAQLRAAAPLTCVVVGRVQGEQLGVVGRDGVFGNDGLFHPLSPGAQGSANCGPRADDGSFFSFSSGPPIPASGYTGAVGTAVGGCRERVNLDGPTVSPQTRRRLKGVPQCSVAGLRRVVAGFAGRRAVSATLVGPGYRKTLRLSSQEDGAYLFVMRSAATSPPNLTITGRGGERCLPFRWLTPTPRAQRAAALRHARACDALTRAEPSGSRP